METDLFNLKGRGAMVVGGGRGMGRASSLLLAQAGCDVAVVDFDDERGRAVADEVRALGREALHVKADVSRMDEVKRMVADSVRGVGKIDVVVNVVGTSEPRKLAIDYEERDWDQIQTLNIKYVFFTLQAAARHIIARKGTGSFINIASISGWDSAPYHCVYGASKAGLMNLTRSLATEWGPSGIRVNAIAPGSIATPRNLEEYARNPGQADKLHAIVPLRRAGTPDDIARVVLFLASDLSSYTTGQTIPVDGGRTAIYRHWTAKIPEQVWRAAPAGGG